jgi:hypothetical protein
MDKANERPVSRLDVPDEDAAAQQESVIPDGSDTEAEHLPPDAPEADYVEQHVSALPAREGTVRPVPAIVDAEASEADLAEQATPVPSDDDEEYPYGTSGGEGAEY